ncbi:hypothetical protein D3C85_1383680 [compost metagenome]
MRLRKVRLYIKTSCLLLAESLYNVLSRYSRANINCRYYPEKGDDQQHQIELYLDEFEYFREGSRSSVFGNLRIESDCARLLVNWATRVSSQVLGDLRFA